MGNIVDTITLWVSYSDLLSQPYGSSFTDKDKLSYKTKKLISIKVSTEINQALIHFLQMQHIGLYLSIESGPCGLLCQIILCACFDCIHSTSYIWCLELLCVNLHPRFVGAGESGRQRSVTHRGRKGREHGSDNQREKYRSVTLRSSHQLQHYTVRHTHAHT